MKKIKFILYSSIVALTLINLSAAQNVNAQNILIGWAMEDITPDGPVSLVGQYYERISKYVQSPLKATALAIESAGEAGNKEQAIMISVDVAAFRDGLQDSLRRKLEGKIPGFDLHKLFLNATHTHSSFFDAGIDSKLREMLLDRLSKVAVTAWENRQPGGISRELGYAVVGHNRRVEFANGSTEMYGSTDRKDFIGFEGPEDSRVDMLFCWDINKNLTGIVMNVACPAQVTEAKYYISADYWSEVRKYLAKRFPGNVYVLPQISAAGDIAPHPLIGNKAGEPNMWDVPGIVEIGKRLGHAIDDAYPDARNTIQNRVVFKHVVKNIELPTRKYSQEDYKKALAIVKGIRSKEPKDPNSPETAWNRFLKEIKDNEKIKEYGPWDNKLSDFGIVKKQEALIQKYKEQEQHPFFPVELHVLRLGDVVFATNPFELYVDYGFRIEGRSRAKQTFLVQLCGGDGGEYIPTQRAIEKKGYRGYSAIVNNVGPKGGQLLVDETVSVIDSLWEGDRMIQP